MSSNLKKLEKEEFWHDSRAKEVTMSIFKQLNYALNEDDPLVIAALVNNELNNIHLKEVDTFFENAKQELINDLNQTIKDAFKKYQNEMQEKLNQSFDLIERINASNHILEKMIKKYDVLMQEIKQQITMAAHVDLYNELISARAILETAKRLENENKEIQKLKQEIEFLNYEIQQYKKQSVNEDKKKSIFDFFKKK